MIRKLNIFYGYLVLISNTNYEKLYIYNYFKITYRITTNFVNKIINAALTLEKIELFS